MIFVTFYIHDKVNFMLLCWKGIDYSEFFKLELRRVKLVRLRSIRPTSAPNAVVPPVFWDGPPLLLGRSPPTPHILCISYIPFPV